MLVRPVYFPHSLIEGWPHLLCMHSRRFGDVRTETDYTWQLARSRTCLSWSCWCERNPCLATERRPNKGERLSRSVQPLIAQVKSVPSGVAHVCRTSVHVRRTASALHYRRIPASRRRMQLRRRKRGGDSCRMKEDAGDAHESPASGRDADESCNREREQIRWLGSS
jgi:hypothetical protein